MVEPNGPPKTQLPGTEDPRSGLSFMAGSVEELAQDVKTRLDGVELNMLEMGLLDKYLETPEASFNDIYNLLGKLAKKNEEYAYALKKIRKVMPLFQEHEFWSTQPVPKYFEMSSESSYNQPIEVKTVADVQQEPYGLPNGYEWTTVDLSDDARAEDVYNLLTNHYVEDTGGKFRFDYSIPFLRWALNLPGFYPDWIIAVQGTKNQQLFAFITAIPVQMVVNGERIAMAEVNFLCVHKKLRTKRLAPLLIKEITRRVNLRNQWQAIYTSGTTLPTPFTTAQYWHRNLNPQKLVEVKFSYMPAGTTMANFTKLHKLPKQTQTAHLRPMLPEDVPLVTLALNEHLSTNYKVHIQFNEAEVGHFFLPRQNVVSSYVVKDDDGVVTDFTSFYALNSSILNDPQHSKLYAAYAYYNFSKGNDPERLKGLIKDALILAKELEYDVFNMTEVLQHGHLKEELFFKPGDGKLAHYLYNWRIKMVKSSDVGIVLV